ncbi:MAG: metal ABC transporter ATP-binding protein [Bacteriovoracaceae bacterium]|nr:metal ABC transporter ATP-binding protein [Bacteriovoracaceae bacterium]
MSLLQVKNISFAYENHDVLKDISFDLNLGEILGVIGPNGGGKTTLLKVLTGLLPFSCGSILLESIPLHESLKKRHISYLPQKINFNSIIPMQVKEFLNMVAPHASLDDVLNRVGLREKKEYQVSTLSMGERQRLLLARCLLFKSKLLILDEPTTGLDSTGQDQFLTLLADLKKDHALILVDHNINQILKSCDKILCLNKTSHWHEKTEMLTQKILESIYHCEFEHVQIHESGKQADTHEFCETHLSHHQHHHSKDKN